MDDKKNDGGGLQPEVREVRTFDDWIETVKTTVYLNRPDGRALSLTIYAVDSETAEQIEDEYDRRKPVEPKPIIDPKTGEERKDRHFEERYKKYELALRQVEIWKKYKYILEGWVKPNGIEVPGNTEDEKIAHMKKSVSGDSDKLYLAILQLSRLGRTHVDFF